MAPRRGKGCWRALNSLQMTLAEPSSSLAVSVPVIHTVCVGGPTVCFFSEFLMFGALRSAKAPPPWHVRVVSSSPADMAISWMVNAQACENTTASKIDRDRVRLRGVD